MRITGDLAGYKAAASMFNVPVIGVHGSFLLINGKAENDCTWEFARYAKHSLLPVIPIMLSAVCHCSLAEGASAGLLYVLRAQRSRF